MSLLKYILLLISILAIFTITDLITVFFWILFAACFIAAPLIFAGVPDSIAIIIAYIITPVTMSSIPIVIVTHINSRKYEYNKITGKGLIVSDLVFSLIKIAVSLIVLIMRSGPLPL